MVQYVTKITTVQIPLADYLAGKQTTQQAVTTQAATTAAAIAANTQSKSRGGLLGFLEGLFDNGDSQSPPPHQQIMVVVHSEVQVLLR